MEETKKLEISHNFQSQGFITVRELKDRFPKGLLAGGTYARFEDSHEWRPVEVIYDTLIKDGPKTKVETKATESFGVAPRTAVTATSTTLTASNTTAAKPKRRKLF